MSLFSRAGPNIPTAKNFSMENDLIAVAMSGGVDSSTVAGLLARRKQRIVGMTMQLWDQRRFPRDDSAGRHLRPVLLAR